MNNIWKYCVKHFRHYHNERFWSGSFMPIVWYFVVDINFLGEAKTVCHLSMYLFFCLVIFPQRKCKVHIERWLHLFNLCCFVSCRVQYSAVVDFFMGTALPLGYSAHKDLGFGAQIVWKEQTSRFLLCICAFY